MLSTIGNVETSMMQFSRTMFSISRDGIFSARWSQVHPQWKTPFAATFLIAFIGATLLLLSMSSQSIAEVMVASIKIIGVQAAYYYGFAGFACAWYFRKKAISSIHLFITMLIWPALSAIALWWAAAITIMGFDMVTAIIAIGSLLLGFIPLIQKRYKPPRLPNHEQ
jgi:amino acid transporter